MVLITLVQRVVRAFDKSPCPFDQPGREQPGEGTENNLLEKCRLHPAFQSRGNASDSLPKAPLLGFHDPEAEQEIRQGVGQDAGG
jgi:hypothetical protein